jgi:cysteinyl-tRNA synthetase
MLGLEPVEEMPRATDEANLRAMCEMIAQLEANGHTYRSDGSIYFRISTLPQYGRLSRLDHAGIQDGARVDSDQYGKENARDFVLWKATKPGEPTWDFGIGPGRPGWHIECSAMALRLLGSPPIDLHAGGIDLIFPHHENEIAQSEGATHQQFSRTWMHVEFLLVDEGEKMSKSLGNVFTVPDVLEHGYRASALRYLLLSVHYRKQLRFSWSSLAQAEEALKRLMDFLARLDGLGADAGPPSPAVADRVARARTEFASAMDDDLNTAGALGEIFELVRDLNAALDRDEVKSSDLGVIREAFEQFDRILGIVSARTCRGARAIGAGASGREAPPRFRCRGPDSPGTGGARGTARGRSGRNPLEAEIIEVWSPTSRPRSRAQKPGRSSSAMRRSSRRRTRASIPS